MERVEKIKIMPVNQLVVSNNSSISKNIHSRERSCSLNYLFKIIIFSLINAVNILVFVFLITSQGNNSSKLFFSLTYWTHWANIFYFASVYICDITKICCCKYKSENFEPFIRNIFFKYNFAYTCMISTEYWALVYMGPRFRVQPDILSDTFFAVYLHIIQLIFVVVEFIWSDHLCLDTYCVDVVILTISYLIYTALAAMAKFVFNYTKYPFLDGTEVNLLIIVMIICFILLLNFYALYQCLILRYKSENKKSGPAYFSDNSQIQMSQINKKNRSEDPEQIIIHSKL